MFWTSNVRPSQKNSLAGLDNTQTESVNAVAYQTFQAHNTQNECQILDLNLLFQSFFVRRREMIMNSLQ